MKGRALTWTRCNVSPTKSAPHVSEPYASIRLCTTCVWRCDGARHASKTTTSYLTVRKNGAVCRAPMREAKWDPAWKRLANSVVSLLASVQNNGDGIVMWCETRLFLYCNDIIIMCVLTLGCNGDYHVHQFSSNSSHSGMTSWCDANTYYRPPTLCWRWVVMRVYIYTHMMTLFILPTYLFTFFHWATNTLTGVMTRGQVLTIAHWVVV